ncbi:MAG: mechanosensitive ion channel family protein, partial [Myxococcales bacterium]|nr:mechanosensitive ion channel family protein [Myxococcales bacterium]
MDEILDTVLFVGDRPITVADAGTVALVVIGSLLASWLIKRALGAVAARSSADSVRGAVIHSLDGPMRWILLMAGLWIGYLLLIDQPIATGLRSPVFLATELPFIIWFANRLTNNLTDIWAVKAESTEGTFDDQLVPVIRTLAKILVVIVGLLLLFQNLGYEVGSLLAGLGIGGAAIALASKDTIANLFGSIVIFVDRPFQIGDWVEIGEQEGTVEEVGLRVTRIRTFANSLITVPNSALTTTAINNWSRMRKRRIKLTIGVTYDATPVQIEQAVEAIREVLHADRRVAQDFMLVNFTDFGASSLDIFVYAFTLTTRWDEYMQVRQELLLEFMRRL